MGKSDKHVCRRTNRNWDSGTGREKFVISSGTQTNSNSNPFRRSKITHSDDQTHFRRPICSLEWPHRSCGQSDHLCISLVIIIIINGRTGFSPNKLSTIHIRLCGRVHWLQDIAQNVQGQRTGCEGRTDLKKYDFQDKKIVSTGKITFWERYQRKVSPLSQLFLPHWECPPPSEFDVWMMAKAHLQNNSIYASDCFHNMHESQIKSFTL